MPTIKQICFTSLLVVVLFSTAAAQNDNATAQRASLTITAAAAADRVRITAPSSVVQMHVEVYAARGEKVFDQEIGGGNVFDWHLQDGQAQRLAPGSYVCVVTAKSVSGKLTQKIGTVRVEEKSVSVQPGDSQQLSAPQAQTIGPVEENSSWTIPGENEPQTTIVIAHDGTDGQMIRGRGALSFRIGNFFSGIDQEQMRLTEAGNLGIGTSEPKAKLEVAGTIRAQRFLIAKPKLATGDKTAGAQATDAADSVQPLVAGTGMTGQLTKWTDGANGTLGDSIITETVSGNIGIGTNSPTDKLEVKDGFISTYHANASFGAGYSLNFYTDTTGSAKNTIGSLGVFQSAANVRAGDFVVNLSNAGAPAEKFRITKAGNIGIGTTNPTDKLEVKDGFISTYHPNASFGAGYSVNFYTDTTGATKNTIGSIGVVQSAANVRAGDFVVNLGNAGAPAERFRINNLGNVGIGTPTPGAVLHVVGTQPPTSVSAIGTDATSVLQIIGGKGGSGNGANDIRGGGAGASALIQAGNGGDSHSTDCCNSGGDGGSITLQAGAAGTYTNSGGSFLMGNGGSITLQAGAGASNPFSFSSPETGGSITLQPGLSGGEVRLAPSGGNVGIGITGPKYALHVVGQNVRVEGNSFPRFSVNFTGGAADEKRWQNYATTRDLTFSALNDAENAETAWLQVNRGTGTAISSVQFPNGIVVINNLGTAGATSLCLNASNHISTCSSSLRYKTDIKSFGGGLNFINRLHPIAFSWKDGGMKDIGFGAEDVEKISPLLVTYNAKGDVEGVKYDRLGVLFVNAIKEQQQTIEKLQQENNKLKARYAETETRLVGIETSVKRMAKNSRRLHRRHCATS